MCVCLRAYVCVRILGVGELVNSDLLRRSKQNNSQRN